MIIRRLIDDLLNRPDRHSEFDQPSEFKSSAGAVMITGCQRFSHHGEPGVRGWPSGWEQQREVTFVNDFYLGKSPVTQAQYEAVTGTNPTDHEQIGDAPVDSVSWESANEYCQKLTKLDREAECSLTTGSIGCRRKRNGNTPAGREARSHGMVTADVAWYHDNADEKPHAVGQKTPNPWGFQDMLGNVWEWCQDWFVANSCRSVRGGSYFNSARFCRFRPALGLDPNNPGRYCGFRLLAAATGSFDLSPPIDDFPTQDRPPSSSMPSTRTISIWPYESSLRIPLRSSPWMASRRRFTIASTETDRNGLSGFWTTEPTLNAANRTTVRRR
jgi:hypothetical protein